MPKQYVSSNALCPFYRGEETKTIYCDGIAQGSTIRLAFGADARDYKAAHCRKDWMECPVARMLWELAEEKDG